MKILQKKKKNDRCVIHYIYNPSNLIWHVWIWCENLIGLSKERPILGDHPKAHIHEIRWILRNLADFTWNLVDFMKSGRFHMKSSGFHVKSTYKTYKSNISRKTLQFYVVLWEGYVMFSHEICQISRNPPDFMKSTGFHVKSAGFRKTNC